MRRLACGVAGIAALLVAAPSAVSGTTRLHVLAQNGTVAAYRTHFLCHRRCSLSAAPRAIVLLERPDRYFSFRHWTGACHGRATACALSLTSSATARAVFTRNRSHVLVTVGGAGSVRVAGASRARCGTASRKCDISWPAGKAIELAAVPDAGGSFGGWGGACADSSGPKCRIVVHGHATLVTAAFATMPSAIGDRQEITVHASNHTVQSSLPGFACQVLTCTAFVATGTLVKLRIHPYEIPAALASWKGACRGKGFTCALVVDGPIDVTAPNALIALPTGTEYGLHVVVGGNGVVTDGRTIKNCTMRQTAHCNGTYSTGHVRLTAKPASGSTFSRWFSQTHLCAQKRRVCTARVDDPSGTTIVAVFRKR